MLTAFTGDIENSGYTHVLNLSFGYSFVPTEDMVITHLKANPAESGVKFTLNISDSVGNLLGSTHVLVSVTYGWQLAALNNPVVLLAGETYTIWASTNGTYADMYCAAVAPTFNANISNVAYKQDSGNAMPTTASSSIWLLDALFIPYSPVDTNIFSNTNAVQEITLQAGEHIFECLGSAASDLGVAPFKYNRGGYSIGKITLTEAKTFYIVAGGNDSNKFNGGEAGGRTGVYSGGASDIRLIGGAWDDITGLNSRIMVAGGGASSGKVTFYGGSGGGLTGGISSGGYGSGGGAGTQTAGGAGSGAAASGTFGKGGNGVEGSGEYGGAGGGGYYGGGGALPDGSIDDDKGGGGGSGFISGLTGCNAITSATDRTASGQPNHYSGLVFSEAEMLDGASVTTGRVTIYSLTENTPPVTTRRRFTQII